MGVWMSKFLMSFLFIQVQGPVVFEIWVRVQLATTPSTTGTAETHLHTRQ